MAAIKKIQKRDGKITDFDLSKITTAIFKSLEATGEPNFDLAKNLSQKAFEIINAQFSADNIPKVEQVQDIVEQVLVEEGQAKAAKAYILYRQKRTEIRKQKQQILQKEEIDEVDKSFDLNALRVLVSRYLRKDQTGNVIESPKQLFERVAVHTTLPSLFFDKKIFREETGEVFSFEDFEPAKFGGKIKIGEYTLNQFHLEALKRLYDRLNKQGQMKAKFSEVLEFLNKGEFVAYGKEIKEYFNLMVERKFFPNTPALVNFGNYLGMGSACFTLPIDDSIESIMDALRKAAIIFKSGGGVGYNFSNLRPEGDFVKSTGGVSSGPLSFMSLFDKMTDVIKQGGVRRGASMGILDSDHPDIEKFITAKRGNQALRNFNISVFIKSDFWDYFENKRPYPLKNPRSGEIVNYVDPQNLLNLIVYQAWESAEPGVIFDDWINKYNPFLQSLGPIKCTNPCISGNSWIMTSEGPKQVSDLIGKKTEVIVDGKKWSNAGHGFFSTGVKPVFQLKTEEGFELSLTGNHPLRKITSLSRYAFDSQWEEAKNLKPGDKLLLNVNKDFEWSGKYSEQEGYLMGLLVGDGTIGKDKTILESWGQNQGEMAVRRTAETYVSSLPHRCDFKGWQSYSKKNKYRLVSSSLRKLANGLGMDNKKRISPEMEKSSSDFYKGFLRGFFDTDGSVQGTQEKGISVRLAQSDLDRLKAVQRMLLRLGIFSRIYQNRRTEGSRELPDGKGGNKLYKIKAQHELVISKESLFDFDRRVGFGNLDKGAKLKNLLGRYKRKLNQERFIITVAGVSFLGYERVYDIQVPGINAFEANGFYVHNCGELPLYPEESCNLGSINVWAFCNVKPTNGRKKEVDFDWKGFEETIKQATRFLDNVIDVNNFPLKEIEEKTLSMRKIGLGLMGLADLLYELGIPYNSSEGLELMEKIMEFLNYHSKVASIELAKERGKFPYYEKTFYSEGRLPFKGREKESGELPLGEKECPWLDWEGLKEEIKKCGLRNSQTTVNAPTGSISMIAGCSSGIEPNFSLVFEKKITVGSFYYVNPVFENVMAREGLFDEELIKEVSEREGSIQGLSYIPSKLKKVFTTALDISAEDHIKALAVLQKWTDSSISKTINFPQSATVEDMKNAYLLAYKLGCKDLTVFRNQSMPGVLKAGAVKEKKPKPEGELVSLKDEKVKGPVIYHDVSTDHIPPFNNNGSNSGEKELCNNCSTPLIKIEGCKKCPKCGWGVCVG